MIKKKKTFHLPLIPSTVEIAASPLYYIALGLLINFKLTAITMPLFPSLFFFFFNKQFMSNCVSHH